MSFGAAWFLLGLGLLAIPIWLHRVKQQTPAETTVSSLLLMRQADEPVRVRRALAYFTLLTLRILLLCAAAFAFAQPFMDRPADPLGAESVEDDTKLLVLDTSMSMQRGDVWDKALAEARALTRNSDAHVVLAGPDLRFSDLALAEPGIARFDFGRLVSSLEGLISAIPDVDESDVAVHIVSDFQDAAIPSQFNALISGTRWPVFTHPIAGPDDNWAITAVNAARRSGATPDPLVAETAIDETAIEVEVRSFATTPRNAVVVVSVDGIEVDRKPVAIRPGASETVEFEVTRGVEQSVGRPTDLAITAELVPGDALGIDDIRRTVYAAGSASALPMISGPRSPAFDYLSAAVVASATQMDPVKLEADGSSVWPGDVNAIAILDVGSLSSEVRRRVSRHVEDGGGALIVVGPRTESVGSLPILDVAIDARTLALAADRVGVNAPAPIRRVLREDESHPVLRSSWEDVEIQRVSTFVEAPTGNVLLALDDGNPLLVEYDVGKGRVLVLMTALDRDWNSLVVRPEFVEFVSDTFAFLAQSVADLQFISGEGVSLPATSAQLFDAEGSRVLALGNTGSRSVVRLDEAGFYTLRTPGRSQRIAVNVDIRESDVRTVDSAILDRWEEATAVLSDQARGSAPVDGPAMSEQAKWPLAPWLLICLAFVAVGELIAANWGRWTWPTQLRPAR